MNNCCPVAPLATLQVDAQLGLISVDDVEASFVRCLAAFNDEQLPDEEALQLQDNTSTSTMRVKRSVDCLLSAPAATGAPSRVKLRCAGLASAVAWLLRGNVGETYFDQLAHTSVRCWRMERAVARARGSTSRGGSQELHAADL